MFSFIAANDDWASICFSGVLCRPLLSDQRSFLMKEKFCVNDYILYVILIEPNLYCNPSSIYWYREREREKRGEREREIVTYGISR